MRIHNRVLKGSIKIRIWETEGICLYQISWQRERTKKWISKWRTSRWYISRVECSAEVCPQQVLSTTLPWTGGCVGRPVSCGYWFLGAVVVLLIKVVPKVGDTQIIHLHARAKVTGTICLCVEDMAETTTGRIPLGLCWPVCPSWS